MISCKTQKYVSGTLRNRLQILLFSSFKSKSINLYSPWNDKKSYDFLMIPGGIEVNQFTEICLILEDKFWDDPYLILTWHKSTLVWVTGCTFVP